MAAFMRVDPGATLNFSSGTISVDGEFNNQQLVIMGTAGPATLRADTFVNAGLLMGQGNIGAALSNTGTIALSSDSSFTEDVTNQSGGKITVSGASVTTFFEDVNNMAGGELRISENSAAVFFGSLSGTGSITGIGTSFIEGDLRPGASPGLLQFGGDVEYGPLALMEIELAGQTLGSEFDSLQIAGSAVLDGALDVSLINGFSPMLGDAFDILTAAGGISGQFSSVQLPPLAQGLRFDLAYAATEVALTVVAADGLPGDFDFDGDRDGRDFLIWQRGGSPNPLSASDLADWEANYGAVASLAAETYAVPEPATWLLAMLFLQMFPQRGRSKQGANLHNL